MAASIDALLRQLFEDYQGMKTMLMAALIVARTGPMIFLTPFLGGKLVPTEIKMGLTVGLTFLVWPLIVAGTDPAAIPLNAFPFMALMLKEAFVGFVIGFVNAHMFFAMDMAGRLIDTVRGTSMSEVQDPHSKQRVTPIGNMYGQLFLIIFTVTGGHLVFMQAYFYSFEALPLHQTPNFQAPGFEGFYDLVMRLTAEILVIAVVLAAPVVAATFISDVVFGILNRVAPQLNAYFMSMPVKALGGVIMIFVAFEAIHSRMNDFVIWALEAIEDSMAMLFQ